MKKRSKLTAFYHFSHQKRCVQIIPKTTASEHGAFGSLSIFLLPINCYGNLAGAI